jgi:activator of 2-hydroxyglutaryl-CoA dehydratase
MCTVFAESEVVSLIAEGKDVNSILGGLCFAIASRNKALFARANAKPPYIMTGGVARNEGVVKALEELLGEKIFVPDEPEIAGALGAAVLAMQRA